MTTAVGLITRAMKLARVIGKGETPDADESADGLVALNSMLDSWQIEGLMVYQIREESFTWSAAAQSRTIGALGNFVTDLPTKVAESSYFVTNNISTGIKLIDVNAWASIPDKTTTGPYPCLIYPEYGAALVTLYAYPTPSANVTFKLHTWKRLQSFSALTTDLALPPGYERAIAFNLAIEFGDAEFGGIVTPRVEKIAIQSKADIKRVNLRVPVLVAETGYVNRGPRYGSIYSGF